MIIICRLSGPQSENQIQRKETTFFARETKEMMEYEGDGDTD